MILYLGIIQPIRTVGCTALIFYYQDIKNWASKVYQHQINNPGIIIPEGKVESYKPDQLIRPEIPQSLKTFKRVIFDCSYLAAHALLNGPLKGIITAIFDEALKAYKHYINKV